FAPGGNVAVENVLQGCAGPSGGMNAIRDGFNVLAWEHAAGNFAVKLGHTIYISTHAQGEMRHVYRRAAAGRFLQIRNISFGTQHEAKQFRRRCILEVEKFLPLWKSPR